MQHYLIVYTINPEHVTGRLQDTIVPASVIENVYGPFTEDDTQRMDRALAKTINECMSQPWITGACLMTYDDSGIVQQREDIMPDCDIYARRFLSK